MDIIKECQESIDINIKKISEEILDLIGKYNRFFRFEEMFSSEQSGKTKLNKHVFNEINNLIQSNILIINDLLYKSINTINNNNKELLSKYIDINELEIKEDMYSDDTFIEFIKAKLDSKVVALNSKVKITKQIKELLFLKNRVNNYIYFVNMFNTQNLDNYLNKLGVEDFIDSKFIFEIINTYGLKFEELKKFEYEIKNLKSPDDENFNFKFLNNFFELHKRKADNYIYENMRYRISINYENSIELKKVMFFKNAYLENIISCLIQQSCKDLIKKELKKGKIHKLIEVNISQNKNYVDIQVKNNGYEVKDIDILNKNENIIEAKNLVKMINGDIKITSIFNEGMLYTLSFKGNH